MIAPGRKPDPAPRTLSVREVAALRGVKPHKVIAWILSEGLVAYDVSSRLSSKPRWRIDPTDLDAFFQRRLEQRRAQAASKRGALYRPRRRKREDAVTEYF